MRQPRRNSLGKTHRSLPHRRCALTSLPVVTEFESNAEHLPPNPVELAHVGPFDSRLVLEFRALVGDVPRETGGPTTNKRDWILRHIASELDRTAPQMQVRLDRFVSTEELERAPHAAVTAPVEARYRYRSDRHRAWLEDGVHASGSLVFDEAGGPSGSRGALLRVEPGWTGDLTDAMVDGDEVDSAAVDAASRRGIDLDTRAQHSARLRELGVRSVRLDRLRLDFFRHGVGVFTVRSSVTADVSRKDLPELMESIGALTPLHPGLVAALDHADRLVGEAYERALAALERELDRRGDFESMKTLERVLFKESSRYSGRIEGVPRWTNTVLLDVAREARKPRSKSRAPLGRATWSILRATPEGGATPAKLHCPGFVIVGWGRSIALDASPPTLASTLDGLRRLQAEWRTLQVLGSELRMRIGRFAKLQHNASTGVGEQLRDIVRLKLECELLQANEDRYLAGAEPVEYAVYVQGRLAWRMDRMVEGVRRSMDSLELLQDAWARRREASEAKRLNIVVLLVGLVAMAGVYTDVVDFVVQDERRGWDAVLRPLYVGIALVLLASVAVKFSWRARLTRWWNLTWYRLYAWMSARSGGHYSDR